MENWFKISADIFDNKKIKIIRAMRNGDSMALMWFFLLSLARQQNDNGYVYATENVAYTPKTLAAVSGFKPKLVETALETFQTYNMIDIEDNGYIYIVGWEEYQNTEALAKLKDKQPVNAKEKNRIRVARYRQKQKCNDNDSSDVMNCNDCNADNSLHVMPKIITCNAENSSDVMDCNDKNKSKNKSKKENSNNNNDNITSNDSSSSDVMPKIITCNANGNADCNAENVVVVVNNNSNLASDNNPVGFWNKNITPITPYIAERIRAVIEEHGETIAMQAVTATAAQGKISIAYFEGVAKNIASGNVRKPSRSPVMKNDVEGSVQKVISMLRARNEEGDSNEQTC